MPTRVAVRFGGAERGTAFGRAEFRAAERCGALGAAELCGAAICAVFGFAGFARSRRGARAGFVSGLARVMASRTARTSNLFPSNLTVNKAIQRSDAKKP